MSRLELVGLDGATVFLPSEQVGSTVGALRQWEAARAGLPSPSLLRLKSGSRDLSSDEAPLADVCASVHALLRLPGGTHPMDAMCRAFPADPQRAILKKNIEAAKYEAYPAPQTAASANDDAKYKAKLDRQRRKLMEGGSDSDSSVSVFDPFMSKKAKKEMKKREKKDKKEKKKRERESSSDESDSSSSSDSDSDSDS